ncbi:hypothetical protein LdCL_280023300 [Leishmania donovani]|uniref:Uncharacterized protein n=1 Tax=Leishmania donovani TaxID=5661 RepID=A0A3S7X1P7_LEIDO|nr:hypothetical protein LdCL_280023300 [Leishmania donovani]
MSRAMLPPSNVYSSVSFRTPVSAAAVSTTDPPGSAAADSAFSMVLPPPPARRGRRMPKDLEGIASRYLQRLGNTFICGAGRGKGGRLDELADDVAAAEGECAGGCKAPSMLPQHSARRGLCAISLASSLAAGVVGTRQDGEAASTTAANRRRHRRVTSLEVPNNGDSAFPLSSPLIPPNTALPKTDSAHARSGDDPSVMPRLHVSQAPGSAQRRRHGGPDALAASRTSENAPGGLTGHLRRRGRGCTNEHLPPSVPRLSRPKSRSGSSTCGSSLASLDTSERGTKVTASPSARCRGGNPAAGEVAAAAAGYAVTKADSLVAEAAELMASAVPPRRKLRDENERAAQVLAQEHSKILLLVGRRANAVADIEDLVEVADAVREKTRQERLNLLPMPGPHATSDVATAPSAGGASPRHQDRGDGHAADRVTSASLLDLTAVRFQLHKLSNDLLCNGSTNLDATQLRQLVYQLDDHVDSVEEVLEVEVGGAASTDAETQPLRGTAGAAVDAEPLPRRSLRQRLQGAKKEQKDLLEASSNLLHMVWLMESVDTELLTDMQHPQPTETRENRATGAGTVAGEQARGGIPLTANEDTAAALMRYTRCQPIPGGALNRSLSTSATITTARECGKAEPGPHERHRASLETTVSEPSMVPFSLTDLTGGNKTGCISTATPTPAAGGQQQWRKGPKDTGAVPSTSTAPSHRLNLLRFMSEVLAQYELEHVDAAKLRKNRPLSAPSMRLHHQVASPSTERDCQQEINGAEEVEAGLNDACSQPMEVTAGDDRARRSADGSLSWARRPPSSTPGAIAATDGGVQPLEADSLCEKHWRSSEAIHHRQNRRGSSTSHDQKVLLGAQLRNLRTELLHDLHELCTTHNYVRLIETRRRELNEGAGKGDAEYAVEMEQKLAGHRLQLEAAKRAREEAARREMEAAALAQVWGQEGNRPRTGSDKRSVTSGGSQRTVSTEEGHGKPPSNAAAPRSASPSSGALQPDKKPSATTLLSGAAVQSRPTEEAVAAAPVETELLREYLADKGLVFTVVGVKRSPQKFAGDGAAATEAHAGAAATHPKKKSGCRVTLGEAKGPNRYLYYELRVEKPLSAPPLESPGFDGATSDATPAPASASSMAAVVQVNTPRLMNLRMTVEAGAAVEEVAKGPLVTMRVTSGAPARRLLTLTPAKPCKAVSYAQAFMFGAIDAARGREQRRRSSHDMWEANSTASATFALPTGDQSRRSGSRSSSLDSRKVRPAKRAPLTTCSAASGGGGASRRSKESVAGKDSKEPTGVKGPDDASKRPGGQSLERAHTPSASGPVTAADIETAKRTPRQGTLASPTSLAGVGAADATATALTEASPMNINGVSNTALSGAAAVMLQPSYASLKASQPSLSTPRHLPHSPPLSFVPRPADEWGVPHAHTEMEAVEKNAVILTVLQTSDEGDAVGAAQPLTLATEEEVAAARASSAKSKSECGGTGASASEQARASVNDSDILSLMEGWRLCGATTFARKGAEGQRMTESPSAADAGASSVVDAIATAILRQAIMDGADGEGDAAEGSVDARGGSVRSGGFRAGVGGEGLTDPARLATEKEMAASHVLHSPAPVEEEHRGGASRTGSHAPPLFPATLIDAPQLSSSPQKRQEQHGGGEQTATGRVSGGGFVPEASTSRAHLVSESARSPSAKPRTMPPPLLITSQSRPLHSLEVGSHGGECIRFDFPDDGAAGAPTTPPLPLLSPANPQPPHKTPRKAKPAHSSATKSPAAPAGAARTSPAPPQGIDPVSDRAEQEAFVPPPVVVVERTPGSAKPYMLLPREAAASLLGPSLRDMARGRPVSSGTGRRAGLDSDTRGGAAAFHKTTDAAPVASLSPLAAAHSVLPTTGAAAAAAADTETLSHVQKFLQTISGEFPRHGATGVGGVDPAANKRSLQATKGAATLALRTELDQLQEDARELFMMDPVRYDTVISELMEQAARALLQGSVHAAAPSPAEKERGGPVAGAAPAFSHSSPLPGLRGGESQAGGGADGLTNTADPATAASFTHERPFCTSGSLPPMLEQFKASEADEDERGRGSGLGLRAPQMNLSSTITTKRGSHINSAGGGVSVLSPRPLHDAFASTRSRLSQAAVASPEDGDGDVEKQRPSMASFPPQPKAQRRPTHTLVMRDGAIDEAARHHRASCADAAAEVERILYEQMKAQLLLRAIIAKMKELWHTKQQHAEAKNRERLAKHRQRLIKRGLAAAWPLEHQRVLHLQKLIHLLDRRVGRAHGWLPHYSDSNVLMDAPSLVPFPRSTGGAMLPAASTGTHAPLASWYRQRAQNTLGAAQDADGVSEAHVCPRYLHYLPQRRLFRYMRLAKGRRVLPLRLVRADIHRSHNQHLLLGYDRIALEDEGEDQGSSYEGRTSDGWPKRKLPRRRRGQPHDHAAPFQESRYEDMKTRGERERYLRRLQRTAAFQRVSKMYSPRTRQEADFPSPFH